MKTFKIMCAIGILAVALGCAKSESPSSVADSQMNSVARAAPTLFGKLFSAYVSHADTLLKFGLELEATQVLVNALDALNEAGQTGSGKVDEVTRRLRLVHEVDRRSGHSRAATAIAEFEDDGLVVTGSKDNSLIFRNSSGKASKTVDVGYAVSVLATHAASNLLAVGGDEGSISLLSRDGSVVGKFPVSSEANYVVTLAFSDDGTRLVSAGTDGTIRVWNVKSLALGSQFKASEKTIYNVDFLDETSLAVGGRGIFLDIWSISGEKITSYNHPDSSTTYSILFAKDKDKVILGSESGTLYTYNASEGPGALVLEKQWSGHDTAVYSLTAVPGSESFVSGGSADGLANIWSYSGEKEQGFNCRGFINDVEYTSSGQVLCVVDSGETGVFQSAPLLAPDAPQDFASIVAKACSWLKKSSLADSNPTSPVCSM